MKPLDLAPISKGRGHLTRLFQNRECITQDYTQSKIPTQKQLRELDRACDAALERNGLASLRWNNHGLFEPI